MLDQAPDAAQVSTDLSSGLASAVGALNSLLTREGSSPRTTVYADLVGIAASRVGDVSAPDVVHNAIANLYSAAGNAAERGDDRAVERYAELFGQRRYVVGSVVNAAVSYWRETRATVPNEALTDDSTPVVGTRVNGISLDDEDLSDFADPADVVTRDIVTDSLYTDVGELVAALHTRRARRPHSETVLTDDEFEHLRLMYRFDPTIAPALTKAQLDRRAARDRSREQRRRQESKRVPGFEPNWGMTTRLAAHLGVHKSTVTARNKALRKKLATIVYLVGVLGRDDAMTSRQATDDHLDVFDGWRADGSKAADVNVCVLAGASVRTWHGAASRVEPKVYLEHFVAAKRRAGERTVPDAGDSVQRRDIIGGLHNVESRYAAAVHSRYPRCVLMCDWHDVPDPVAVI